MAVIFPDVEELLVSFLIDALADIDLPIADNVRVGTIKLGADAVRPSKEVILVGAYNETLDVVRRVATATVDVYGDTYEEASELALLVAALIVNCTDGAIKRAVVSLGPVRILEESNQEKRSMTVDLIVKGSDL